MIDLTKCKRRDGGEFRVIPDIRGSSTHPIIGAIKNNDGCWVGMVWAPDGRTVYGSQDRPHDLVPKDEEECWLNVYEDPENERIPFLVVLHPSRKQADKESDIGRIARIQVKWRRGQFDE